MQANESERKIFAFSCSAKLKYATFIADFLPRCNNKFSRSSFLSFILSCRDVFPHFRRNDSNKKKVSLINGTVIEL